jgi:hypothetical protein
MGLKGYRLWVTGQLDSNVQSPTGGPPPLHLAQHQRHGVALQVAFEKQILKPVFHLIGYRLWV